MHTHRSIRRLLAGVAMVAAAAANAQPTAGGNVKILVGFPAGGAVDAVARAFADQLRQQTGGTAVVENKAGASGKIAIEALLAGPATGETVAVIPSSVLVLTPQVLKSVKYDAVRDFTPLGSLAEYGFGVASGPASKVATVAAYKEWAKANPLHSSYATPGLGTPQHFLGSQLQKLLGVDLNHVPYRGGAAAVTDVLGGQVAMLISVDQLFVAHEGQGKLNTLLVTSRTRNPKLPNVPTAREAGLPQLEAVDWYGLFAKKDTPPAKVAEWKAVLAKVIASPKYIASVKEMGYSVPDQQPSDFTKTIESERTAWTERVKLSGFTAAD